VLLSQVVPLSMLGLLSRNGGNPNRVSSNSSTLSPIDRAIYTTIQALKAQRLCY
jgi:hypothetical protein